MASRDVQEFSAPKYKGGKTFFFICSNSSVLLCSCCQEEFAKASIMQNVLWNDLTEIYLRLHIYTGLFYII